MKKYAVYYLPILLFILMLLDSHITTFITALSQGIYLANSHFIFLAALIASNYFPKRYMLITMTVLGLVYDSYYIGVIGVYAVAFPLVVYLMYSLGDIIHTNIFTLFFGWVILITIFEVYSILVQWIFQFSTVGSLFFITRYLGPTLLLNILIFILFNWPFKKLLSR
ncbi:rod shape-determining protein MreD [Enterococcus sp. LJL120]